MGVEESYCEDHLEVYSLLVLVVVYEGPKAVLSSRGIKFLNAYIFCSPRLVG